MFNPCFYPIVISELLPITKMNSAGDGSEGRLAVKINPVTATGEVLWILANFTAPGSASESSDGKTSRAFSLKFPELDKTFRFYAVLNASSHSHHSHEEFQGYLYCFRHDNTKFKVDFDLLSPRMLEEAIKTIGKVGGESEKVPAFLGYPSYVGHKRLFRDLRESNDTLALKVKISVTKDVTDMSIAPDMELRRDMMSMLRDGKHSDFQIICGDRKFPCHKAILSMKSKVFDTMFESSVSKESQSGCVFIEDCEPEDVWTMLEFIYTGSLEDEVGFCSEGVLKIGDKYDVTNLIAKCTETMTDGLNMDNAIATLITADRFSMTKFKHLVAEHIFRKLSELIDTVQWKAMVKHHPHVMEDILRVKIAKD